ncbi:MAG: RNA polymerase sigma factor [Candidatus Didemnitutus sp.]|nr:RNA polymerase sigma factor [Candidatus Didemnitutus sp.]
MSSPTQPPSTNLAASAPPASQAQWFRDEVHAHDASLKAYLRGQFPSVRDVDDVVQESYLRVWRRQVSNPIQSAKSFLYKVARHLAIDTLRHHRASPVDAVADISTLEVLDAKPSAADAACTSEEIDLLVEAIETLPPRCREIVILRKLRGLSQKDIAARMGIEERTVETQGAKGLDRCENFLRARGVTGLK